MSDYPTHNHMTRDIKPPGVCPLCDEWHGRTADRDDLAAILAKHKYDHPELVNGLWHVVCVCGESIHVPAGDNDHAVFRAHVASMVLESDWLRERDGDKWAEGNATGRGDQSAQQVWAVTGGTRPTDTPNPYRADRVDAEDGRR